MCVRILYPLPGCHLTRGSSQFWFRWLQRRAAVEDESIDRSRWAILRDHSFEVREPDVVLGFETLADASLPSAPTRAEERLRLRRVRLSERTRLCSEPVKSRRCIPTERSVSLFVASPALAASSHAPRHPKISRRSGAGWPSSSRCESLLSLHVTMLPKS